MESCWPAGSSGTAPARAALSRGVEVASSARLGIEILSSSVLLHFSRFAAVFLPFIITAFRQAELNR